MRRLTGTCLALMLAAPAVHAAGVTLNWDHCIGSGVQHQQTFDCANVDAFHTLVVELQAPAAHGVFAVDIVLDVVPQTERLDSFWHMEGSGCNNYGLSISVDRSSLPGAAGCLPDLIEGGSGTRALITNYVVGFGGPNRGRIMMELNRSPNNPIDLAAGSNYYLRHLAFSMASSCAGGNPCFGCEEPVAVVFEGATLYTNPATIPTGAVSVPYDPAVGSQCALINASPPDYCPYYSCPTYQGCFTAASAPSVESPNPTPENDCSKVPTAVKSRTWGMLKALYR